MSGKASEKHNPSHAEPEVEAPSRLNLTAVELIDYILDRALSRGTSIANAARHTRETLGATRRSIHWLGWLFLLGPTTLGLVFDLSLDHGHQVVAAEDGRECNEILDDLVSRAKLLPNFGVGCYEDFIAQCALQARRSRSCDRPECSDKAHTDLGVLARALKLRRQSPPAYSIAWEEGRLQSSGSSGSLDSLLLSFRVTDGIEGLIGFGRRPRHELARLLAHDGAARIAKAIELDPDYFYAEVAAALVHLTQIQADRIAARATSHEAWRRLRDAQRGLESAMIRQLRRLGWSVPPEEDGRDGLTFLTQLFEPEAGDPQPLAVLSGLQLQQISIYLNNWIEFERELARQFVVAEKRLEDPNWAPAETSEVQATCELLYAASGGRNASITGVELEQLSGVSLDTLRLTALEFEMATTSDLDEGQRDGWKATLQKIRQGIESRSGTKRYDSKSAERLARYANQLFAEHWG